MNQKTLHIVFVGIVVVFGILVVKILDSFGYDVSDFIELAQIIGIGMIISGAGYGFVLLLPYIVKMFESQKQDQVEITEEERKTTIPEAEVLELDDREFRSVAQFDKLDKVRYNRLGVGSGIMFGFGFGIGMFIATVVILLIFGPLLVEIYMRIMAEIIKASFGF